MYDQVATQKAHKVIVNNGVFPSEMLTVDPIPGQPGVYRVESIPFISRNVSYGDIISAEADGTSRYPAFTSVKTPSGNSTVSLLLREKLDIGGRAEARVYFRLLIEAGCMMESHEDRIYTFNIPREIFGEAVSIFSQGERKGLWTTGTLAIALTFKPSRRS